MLVKRDPGKCFVLYRGNMNVASYIENFLNYIFMVVTVINVIETIVLM